GRETRLHPRLGVKATLARLAGQQAGSNHHRRVGRVGATRDVRDEHRTVLQLEALSIEARARNTPGGRIARGALFGGLPAVDLVDLARRLQRHAILRSLGPRETGLYLPQIQLQHVRVIRSGVAVVAPHALRLGIHTYQIDPLARAAGELQIPD